MATAQPLGSTGGNGVVGGSAMTVDSKKEVLLWLSIRVLSVVAHQLRLQKRC